MVPYATPAELATYMGSAAPSNAVELLDVASAQLDRDLLGAAYAVDANGLPTESFLITAFRREVCRRVQLQIGQAGSYVDPEGNVVPVVPPFDGQTPEVDVTTLVSTFLRVVG